MAFVPGLRQLEQRSCFDEVGKLGVKLLTGGTEHTQAAPHALGFSAAAPLLCPMIANGDLPLVDGDDIDYKTWKSDTRMDKSSSKQSMTPSDPPLSTCRTV